MTFAVRAERFLGDDVRGLVIKLDDDLRPVAPRKYRFGLNFEEMTRRDFKVFVCRNSEGEAVAMGTLKTHPCGTGEVKRMYTDPALRRRGLARKILKAIIDSAMARGMTRLVIETGAQEEYRPARILYESFGFTPCDTVLDYAVTDHSRYYEKTLEA
ncbi:GNAT family N-acetyltransferase [Fulvimarina sp. 2208YS6-2-32]|uniref:GNAT family N-acetyltransferase n=1 Tax=Fulvimarina uroteuthidis TaxID=3098149 RepID=A0ABU5I3W5_9HYPH|nr:GNAT family N-acetyltransferase [Fulvimarina sp. 2208YS6-2-32]MDY8109782.1 GNAT family N-acetyltransferase [Fulvimarina sp. 2208YS6-2-32]